MITSRAGDHERAALALAELTREPGEVAAHMHARAWKNNVARLAIAALAGAAAALTTGDALPDLTDPAVEPNWTLRELVNCCDDLARVLDDLGKRSAQAITKTRADFAAAVDAYNRAVADYRRAESDLRNADRKSPAYQTAEARMAEAKQRARRHYLVCGDCERALAELDSVIRRVAYAHQCVLRLPWDVATVYAEHLELIADGHALPRWGWWFEDTEALPDAGTLTDYIAAERTRT